MASFRRGVKQRQNRTKKLWVHPDFLWVTANRGASSPFPQGQPFAVTRSLKGACVVIFASFCVYRRRQSRPPNEIRPKELWKDQCFYAVFA